MFPADLSHLVVFVDDVSSGLLEISRAEKIKFNTYLRCFDLVEGNHLISGV